MKKYLLLLSLIFVCMYCEWNLQNDFYIENATRQPLTLVFIMEGEEIPSFSDNTTLEFDLPPGNRSMSGVK